MKYSGKSYHSLHSTMFLLIQISQQQLNQVQQTLHSTMFLLIPEEHIYFTLLSIFTFHNVSINTGGLAGAVGNVDYFTFHNVSIKTVDGSCDREGYLLYIPQCFY